MGLIVVSADEPLDSPTLMKNRLEILKERHDHQIDGKQMVQNLASFFDRDDVNFLLNSYLSPTEEDAIASLR